MSAGTDVRSDYIGSFASQYRLCLQVYTSVVFMLAALQVSKVIPAATRASAGYVTSYSISYVGIPTCRSFRLLESSARLTPVSYCDSVARRKCPVPSSSGAVVDCS